MGGRVNKPLDLIKNTLPLQKKNPKTNMTMERNGIPGKLKTLDKQKSGTSGSKSGLKNMNSCNDSIEPNIGNSKKNQGSILSSLEHLMIPK